MIDNQYKQMISKLTPYSSEKGVFIKVPKLTPVSYGGFNPLSQVVNRMNTSHSQRGDRMKDKTPIFQISKRIGILPKSKILHRKIGNIRVYTQKINYIYPRHMRDIVSMSKLEVIYMCVYGAVVNVFHTKPLNFQWRTKILKRIKGFRRFLK